MTDPVNCGDCDTFCADGARCSSGHCVTPEPATGGTTGSGGATPADGGSGGAPDHASGGDTGGNQLEGGAGGAMTTEAGGRGGAASAEAGGSNSGGLGGSGGAPDQPENDGLIVGGFCYPVCQGDVAAFEFSVSDPEGSKTVNGWGYKEEALCILPGSSLAQPPTRYNKRPEYLTIRGTPCSTMSHDVATNGVGLTCSEHIDCYATYSTTPITGFAAPELRLMCNETPESSTCRVNIWMGNGGGNACFSDDDCNAHLVYNPDYDMYLPPRLHCIGGSLFNGIEGTCGCGLQGDWNGWTCYPEQ